MKIADPMKNMATAWALAAHLNHHIRCGALYKAGTDDKGKFVSKDLTMNFNHRADKTDAGAELKYSFATKKIATRLGLKLVQADHTYKFRLHNNGLVVAAL